jgi:hypothetical protein
MRGAILIPTKGREVGSNRLIKDFKFGYVLSTLDSRLGGRISNSCPPYSFRKQSVVINMKMHASNLMTLKVSLICCATLDGCVWLVRNSHSAAMWF